MVVCCVGEDSSENLTWDILAPKSASLSVEVRVVTDEQYSLALSLLKIIIISAQTLTKAGVLIGMRVSDLMPLDNPARLKRRQKQFLVGRLFTAAKDVSYVSSLGAPKDPPLSMLTASST